MICIADEERREAIVNDEIAHGTKSCAAGHSQEIFGVTTEP